MIALEGRVLAGLDEFMLRLGHLKVLAGVARDIGGSWNRIEREFARFITESRPVPAESVRDVTDYLARKRLCPSATEPVTDDEREAKYRYPEVRIDVDEDGDPRLRSESGEVRIWRQDLWMAAPDVRSKVGAVTVSAKAGSKTGVSHIRDWATLVELFSAAGQLAPEGHMAIMLGGDADGENWRSNPYVLGFERIVFAHLILPADIDLFVRLAPRLANAKVPLRRSDATEVFADALAALSRDAESTRSLSSTRQYRLQQKLREIQGQHQRTSTAKSTTTWHRAASRFETYVDLGFLDKGRGGEAERYEYTYYPTPALQRCVQTLDEAGSADQWVEGCLAACVFDTDTSEAMVPAEEVGALLQQIAPTLGRPISLLPIVPMALGLTWLRAAASRPISLRAARDSIEGFARVRPDYARLSRGGSGSRAEFISLLTKLGRG